MEVKFEPYWLNNKLFKNKNSIVDATWVSLLIAWCAIYPQNRTRNYLRFIRELINKPDWSYLIVVRKVYPGSLVRHLVCPWLWVGQNFYQAITHRLYCLLHLLFNSLLLHMSNIEGLNTSFRWRWNRSPLTIKHFSWALKLIYSNGRHKIPTCLLAANNIFLEHVRHVGF